MLFNFLRKKAMFIQTENTPNPETVKFIPGNKVLEKGTAEFKSEEEAKASPLAQRLFGINGVKAVFLATDFVSVTKEQEQDWGLLTPHIMNSLMEFFTSGLPALEEAVEPLKNDDQEENEIILQIKEILEERVRPAVAQDGGDIEFDRFEEGIVYLHLRGACSGCPSSTLTLKAGVENLLKHFIPEVEAVEAVPDPY
jgi:Fe-S cluster biogenesis protein NfuA